MMRKHQGLSWLGRHPASGILDLVKNGEIEAYLEKTAEEFIGKIWVLLYTVCNCEMEVSHCQIIATRLQYSQRIFT